MTGFLVSVLGVVMITGALAAVYMKNMASAVIVSGVVSLSASIAFLLADAPDVAMTEAAIGSGLTTIVFLYALRKMRASGEDTNG